MRTAPIAFLLAATIAFSFTRSSADEAVRMHGGTEKIAEAHRLEGHQGDVTDAVWLPDGSLLTSGIDGTLRWWDAAAGRQLAVVAQQSQPITKLLLGHDRRQVLSFSASGAISAWQLPAPKRAWGPEQATGAPDTASMRDQQTAWASLTEDGQAEWLLLEYDEAVTLTAVRVYETFNPGAVAEVVGIGVDGKEATLWKAGQEAKRLDSQGPGVELPVSAAQPVKRVKLVIDSPGVAGWNEIDAVGLVDQTNNVHWARSAAASSTYAERSELPSAPVRTTPAPAYSIPEGAERLTHVDDSAEGKQSFGGSGHAVMFEREGDADRLAAIEVFGSRYGMPQPPDEDFTVYVLDEDQQVVETLKFPYAMFQRGDERWVVLGVDEVKLPEKFGIALDFNAHQTKGVYVGKDDSVAVSHSLVGTPKRGFKPADEKFDWMVRAHVVGSER